MKYPRIWIAAKGGSEKVAGDPDTPEKILRLVVDDGVDVRLALSNNPNTPLDVVRRLTRDDHLTIRLFASGNPHLTASDMRRLVTDVDGIKQVVARHLNTPVDILKQLATADDPLVRRGVASNPNTPAAVVRELTQDHHRMTSLTAKTALEKRRAV